MMAPSGSGIALSYAADEMNDSMSAAADQESEFAYKPEKEEEHAPVEFSATKAILYPFMLLLSPFIFPGYYVFTDETEISQSFHNYLDDINYNVPVKVEDLESEGRAHLREAKDGLEKHTDEVSAQQHETH